ncbi:hypothetical protein lerEdw1_009738 [Lerista edwardsae]|nr:hypothetical protein lerEdw1_009738 [Lerista edwardsae]
MSDGCSWTFAPALLLFPRISVACGRAQLRHPPIPAMREVFILKISSLVFFLLSTVTLVTALSTNQWIVNMPSSYGPVTESLWTTCDPSGCTAVRREARFMYSINVILVLTAAYGAFFTADLLRVTFCQKTAGIKLSHMHILPVGLKVVQTLLFVAAFFALGAVVILSISFFRTHIKWTSLAMLSGIASITAGVFIMIGLSLYTHGSQKEKTTVHTEWSYSAGWVSSSLFLLTGVATLMICRKEPPWERPEPQEPRE